MKLIEIQRHYFRLDGEPENVYFCTKADTDAVLNVKRVWYVPCNNTLQVIAENENYLVGDDLKRIRPLQQTLGMAYEPASDIHRLNTNTPDSMGYDLHQALAHLKESVGNVTDFVCERLQWSRDEIEDRLFAEQVDAVALAIYNFEARHQSMIIGDQTGIGKGRIASCIIRYAVVQGYMPVYCTEKTNLFTDNYRDLSDIGSADLVPFIVNSSADANITRYDAEADKDVVVHRPLSAEKKKEIYARLGEYPADPVTGREFDYILLTYSQLNKAYKQGSRGKVSEGEDFYKLAWLQSFADSCIYIFDESHNISGSKAVKTDWWKGDNADVTLAGSNIFMAFGLLAKESKHSLFLSATYAKRPENLVIYAQRTCIQDAELGNTDLISAISNGGEALQEIISSSIVKEGQMIRRESSYSGIETNYIYLNAEDGAKYHLPDMEADHRTKCDFITNIINKMNAFEKDYIIPAVDNQASGTESGELNDKKLGASHDPIFSKLHQIVAQLLYAIKAPAVAEHAINLLNEGKKVVIAVANTMGSQLEDYKEGDEISCDFSQVLKQGMDRMFNYRMKDSEDGSSRQSRLSLADLPEAGQKAYFSLMEEIENASSGITLSPIDLIVQRIEEEHWNVGEVTGRSKKIQLTNEDGTEGIVQKRTKEKKNVVFSQFQNNKLDVLVINSSGSTGASAHATTKNTNLKPEEVKPRVMIIAQAELDINTEVQKRGRINRTGQIKEIPPRYDYLISAIPAEKRLMMILQKKLKSLDANTTSNQKQSSSIIDVPDFINIIGDEVCDAYLNEHPDILAKLNMDATKSETAEGSRDDKKVEVDFAQKVTRYIPVLACEEQEDFYNSVSDAYDQKVKDLKARGEYTLEVENLDLDARLVGQYEVIAAAKRGLSTFAEAVYRGKFDCKNLNKPYNRTQIEMMISNYLQGEDAKEKAKSLSERMYKNFAPGVEAILKKHNQRVADEMERYTKRKAKAEKSGDAEKMAECDNNLSAALEKLKARMEATKKHKQMEMNRRRYVEFFYAGRALLINTEQNIRGIALGTIINNKSEQGFNLSNVIVQIAVADSRKRLELNLCDKDAEYLETIMLRTKTLDVEDVDARWLDDWNDAVKELSTDRETRDIILGNILLGYDMALKLANEAKENGGGGKAKLISFTTANKEVLKGVLLPKASRLANVVFLGRYDIRKMLPIFRKVISDGDIGAYTLTRKCALYIDSKEIKFKIQTQKTFNELSNHRLEDFEKLDYRSRTFTDEKSGWEMKCHTDKLDELVTLLSSLGFEVELHPQDAEKYFPAGARMRKGNWRPLDVDVSDIPQSTKMMQEELDLLELQ